MKILNNKRSDDGEWFTIISNRDNVYRFDRCVKCGSQLSRYATFACRLCWDSFNSAYKDYLERKIDIDREDLGKEVHLIPWYQYPDYGRGL